MHAVPLHRDGKAVPRPLDDTVRAQLFALQGGIHADVLHAAPAAGAQMASMRTAVSRATSIIWCRLFSRSPAERASGR